MSAFTSRSLSNLEEVNASALPAKVLVLLSKYAHALRKHNGLILKLSSMNVFRHVHSTNHASQHEVVHAVHAELLAEVKRHVEVGTMYTNAHKRFRDMRVSRHYSASTLQTRAQLINLKDHSARVRARGQIIGSAEIEPRLSALAD